MNYIKSFLFCIPVIFLFSTNSTFAQTKEQREVIKQSMSSEDSLRVVIELEKYSAERKERVNRFLAENPEEKKQFVKNGKVYLLYDVTKSGKPIYRTLKQVIRKNKRK